MAVGSWKAQVHSTHSKAAPQALRARLADERMTRLLSVRPLASHRPPFLPHPAAIALGPCTMSQKLSEPASAAAAQQQPAIAAMAKSKAQHPPKPESQPKSHSSGFIKIDKKALDPTLASLFASSVRTMRPKRPQHVMLEEATLTWCLGRSS